MTDVHGCGPFVVVNYLHIFVHELKSMTTFKSKLSITIYLTKVTQREALMKQNPLWITCVHLRFLVGFV